VKDDELDAFLIGGNSIEEILLNYRKITGFPALPPTWSFGCWMSRFFYASGKEMTRIADQLRAEKYPMDVLHVDPAGFLSDDWHFDWRLPEDRFPDPRAFFEAMRKKGFRISFWQWPYIQGDTAAGQTAVANGYVGTRTNALESKECPMGKAVLCIDLTNPAAVEWYQGLLRHVLDQGASVIKVDFGEWADEQAAYKGTTGAKYRNLHALLYQRAVWEITKQTKGEGIIWARSGWAGSQRYPVHWSGDCFCTYEGLHSCLCGGFHLGLSGFAF
jgi:alpha-D-xyloside xylohydrolase